jgi:hypothetical protein
MFIPRDLAPPPANSPNGQTLRAHMLFIVSAILIILGPILLLLAIVYLYAIELLVITWPGSAVEVRNSGPHHPASGRYGTFIWSFPFLVCMWHSDGVPGSGLAVYWLHQVTVYHFAREEQDIVTELSTPAPPPTPTNPPNNPRQSFSSCGVSTICTGLDSDSCDQGCTHTEATTLEACAPTQ